MDANTTVRPYILGIDVGVASIGLALLDLDEEGDPVGIRRGYVRTWPAPEGAGGRRQKRSMRRNIARRGRRLNRVADILEQAGMLASPRTGASPVALRAKASRMKVSLQELAEAILHIAKHRGKPDMRRPSLRGEEDQEEGLVNSGITSLKAEMDRLGLKTYGQYLRWREKRGLPTRIKPGTGQGGKGESYAFFPSRKMLEQEFDEIWECQRQASPGGKHFINDLRDRLRDEVFFQRDVTFPPPGNCPYNPNEPRLAKATQLFQKRRIYEATNHLRFYDRFGEPIAYDTTMRDRLVEILMDGESLSQSAIKAHLGLKKTDTVNVHTGDVPREVKGNPIGPAFAAASLTSEWEALNDEDQDAVLDALASNRSLSELRDSLSPFLASDEAIDRAMSVRLPRGYGRMGRSATQKILKELKAEVVPARVAEDNAGLQHAMTPTENERERLPYYGEILRAHTAEPMWVSNYRRETDSPPSTNANEQQFGRIPNPVVHVALNQLRKMVNQVLRNHGRPEAIHVELARDLQRSQEARDERTKENDRRRKSNDRIREEIQKLGAAPSRKNMQRYKLWEQQKHRCIYTGQSIGCSRLYGDDIDVDHVIPRACLGDGISMSAIDSMGNRVVCLRSANAYKGARTPHEAFSHSPDGYDWPAIMRRVGEVGGSTEKRFKADAREAFAQAEEFRGRDGVDNAYIARITRQYLSCLYGGNQSRVIAISSHLMSLLRGKWGLSSVFGDGARGGKGRDDHRHHYVDALIAACANRGVVQSIHTESARCSQEGIGDFVKRIPPPFGDAAAFHSKVKASLDSVAVSRKADHAIGGELHEETLLGIAGLEDEKGCYTTVQHKSLRDYDTFASLDKAKIKIKATLSDTEPFKEARHRIESVRKGVRSCRDQAIEELEEEIRRDVAEGKRSRSPSPQAIYSRAVDLYSAKKKAVSSFALYERKRLVNVRRSGNQEAGGYVSGRNHRVEIYADSKGKVRMETISMLDANKRAFVSQSSLPGNRLIWKAHKDDLLLMDDPGDGASKRVAFRVVKFSEGKIGVVRAVDSRPSGGENKRDMFEKGLKFFYQHQAQRVVTNTLGERIFHFEKLPKTGRIASQ